MKIIPLSLFFAGITLFSCSNESTNNLSTNSQKVKLNKNEVLSIAYDDAKELTDKDIFNMVSSFANMNNNGVSRSTSASFKITKRTYINKEGEFQNKGEFYQFNLSSCIRQQNSLTAQFVSFSLSNLANIFYPPNFYNN